MRQLWLCPISMTCFWIHRCIHINYKSICHHNGKVRDIQLIILKPTNMYVDYILMDLRCDQNIYIFILAFFNVWNAFMNSFQSWWKPNILFYYNKVPFCAVSFITKVIKLTSSPLNSALTQNWSDPYGSWGRSKKKRRKQMKL